VAGKAELRQGQQVHLASAAETGAVARS